MKAVRFFRPDAALHAPAPCTHILCAALAACVALLLASCSNADFDGAVEGARRTGEYPNLNIRPESAAPQISPDEAGADRAGLTAFREAIAEEGADRPESQRESLEALREGHAKRVIDEIEGN